MKIQELLRNGMAAFLATAMFACGATAGSSRRSYEPTTGGFYEGSLNSSFRSDSRSHGGNYAGGARGDWEELRTEGRFAPNGRFFRWYRVHAGGRRDKCYLTAFTNAANSLGDSLDGSAHRHNEMGLYNPEQVVAEREEDRRRYEAELDVAQELNSLREEIRRLGDGTCCEKPE